MRIVDVSGRQAAVKMLLEDPNTYAASLALIAFDEYEQDWLSWHPTTLSMELEEDFHAKIPRTTLDKLLAVNVILTTDTFYNSLPSFVEICNVMADNDYDPETFDPATLEEMAWALTEIFLLDPPDDMQNIFNEEIKAYIRRAVADDGLLTPPDILRIASTGDEADPSADFADDPEMYTAIWDLQKSKTADVENMIKKNVKALTLQLENLPLRNGSTKKFVEKVRGAGLLE